MIQIFKIGNEKIDRMFENIKSAFDTMSRNDFVFNSRERLSVGDFVALDGEFIKRAQNKGEVIGLVEEIQNEGYRLTFPNSITNAFKNRPSGDIINFDSQKMITIINQNTGFYHG